MPWPDFDTAAVARALSQIGDQPEDVVDAFFERREDVELPPDDEAPGPRTWREEGFAIRLLRQGRTWLASRDELAERAFAEALRQVARAFPSVGYPEPRLQAAPPAVAADWREMRDFPAAVERAIRAHHVAFPVRLTARRHRREVQVVGPRLVAPAQSESWYSYTLESQCGRTGALLTRLDAAAAAEVAAAVVALFRARHAASPPAGPRTVVLAPAVVAVLLHEAVAHALEADTLARGGRPEAALGVSLGAACLDVLDDPAAAPAEVRRFSDDEGMPVCRRWLLRQGVVEQPLADLAWSRAAPAFVPGAGRRGSRHLPPGPRSSHLELVSGEQEEADLLSQCEGGLYLAAASRGSLDALSGEFRLHLPHARRIRSGNLAEPVGPCTLRGQVAGLLSRATAVARPARAAGAGWCAKGGQKLPVWATVPALRLEGVEIGA